MEGSKASYQIVADLLARETGQQLAESRLWRVNTALSGVFRENEISNVDQLVCLLDGPDRGKMSQKVVEALLNNETYFFRDKPTFNQLPEVILPKLAAKRASSKRLSIWCAGCSTGQEVYSIIMALRDNPDVWDGWSIEILGTDISNSAISVARRGNYSQFEVQRGLSVMEMLQYFDETQDGWQIKEDVRSSARFDRHNVLNEPPALHSFDLVLCRNVLLYFDYAVKKRAFDRLHSSLSRDGYLMLGAGETVVGHTSAFAPVEGVASLYEVHRNPIALAS